MTTVYMLVSFYIILILFIVKVVYDRYSINKQIQSLEDRVKKLESEHKATHIDFEDADKPMKTSL